jgi:transcriptional regulator with XRE-family HTH domain
MRTESHFGKKTRELRIERGWSQEELAEIAGLSTRTVQRVEKDQTQDGQTLRAIAAAFNVSISDLKTDYWVAEAKPARSLLIQSAEDFGIAIRRAYHYFSYRSLVEPNDKAKVRINELMDEIFADIWIMDPNEPGLINSYVNSIQDAFEELKGMGLIFFTVQECRDVFIKGRQPGERHPLEDMTYCHFFLMPTHGCFREDDGQKAGPLHLFASHCRAAVNTLLGVIQNERQIAVASNALFAICAEARPDEFRWCDVCFPQAEDGSRISLDYLQKITGLSADELANFDAQVQCEESQVQ